MQRQFHLRPSRHLSVLLLAAHAATIAILFPLPFPVWVKLTLALLLLSSLLHHLLHTAGVSMPSACTAFVLDGDHVTLTLRDGNKVDGKLLPDTLVTPWLTIVNILPHQARFARSLVILPDSMDAESFRRLRVQLKWAR